MEPGNALSPSTETAVRPFLRPQAVQPFVTLGERAEHAASAFNVEDTFEARGNSRDSDVDVYRQLAKSCGRPGPSSTRSISATGSVGEQEIGNVDASGSQPETRVLSFPAFKRQVEHTRPAPDPEALFNVQSVPFLKNRKAWSQYAAQFYGQMNDSANAPGAPADLKEHWSAFKEKAGGIHNKDYIPVAFFDKTNKRAHNIPLVAGPVSEGQYRIVDPLTNRVYEGTDRADTMKHFLDENRYPEGKIRYQDGGEVKQQDIPPGEGRLDTLSKWWGLAAMAGVALELAFPATIPLAGLLGASGLIPGAYSAGKGALDLADKHRHGQKIGWDEALLETTQVAGLALGLGSAKALRGLEAGTSGARYASMQRYLLAANVVNDTAAAAAMSKQLVDIAGRDDISSDDKAGAVFQTLATLAISTGLNVRNIRSVGGARGLERISNMSEPEFQSFMKMSDAERGAFLRETGSKAGPGRRAAEDPTPDREVGRVEPRIPAAREIEEKVQALDKSVDAARDVDSYWQQVRQKLETRRSDQQDAVTSLESARAALESARLEKEATLGPRRTELYEKIQGLKSELGNRPKDDRQKKQIVGDIQNAAKELAKIDNELKPARQNVAAKDVELQKAREKLTGLEVELPQMKQCEGLLETAKKAQQKGAEAARRLQAATTPEEHAAARHDLEASLAEADAARVDAERTQYAIAVKHMLEGHEEDGKDGIHNKENGLNARHTRPTFLDGAYDNDLRIAGMTRWNKGELAGMTQVQYFRPGEPQRWAKTVFDPKLWPEQRLMDLALSKIGKASKLVEGTGNAFPVVVDGRNVTFHAIVRDGVVRTFFIE